MKLAQLVSTLVSPPLVAGATFLTLLAFERPTNYALDTVLALIFGTVLPLTVVLFIRRGTDSSTFDSRHSRIFQFILAIGGYATGSILLSAVDAPRSVITLMLCYFGNSIVTMLVSLRWKISVHASGVTGPCTILTWVLGPFWVPLFLLTIPIGWARVREGAHTPLQVVAGALLTVLTTWLQLRLLL